MHAASLDVLCNFVIEAWGNVKVESVIKSFKKCSVSKAVDGTKDDDLFDSNTEVDPLEPDSMFTFSQLGSHR